MTTKFQMIRDIAGLNGFGLPFSDTNYTTTLSSGGADQTFTVPNTGSGNNSWLALFSVTPGGNVYIANNTTVTLPTSSFAPSVTQLNPIGRLVNGGDVLHFNTTDSTVVVGVSLYAL